MRNHEQRHGGAFQKFFQPFHHFKVEVIGRFIENKQVGFADKDIGQCHPFELSAGEMSDFLFEIGDFQFAENLFDTGFIIPGFQYFHACQHVVHFILVGMKHHVFVFSNGAYDVVIGLQAGINDRKFFRKIGRLIQVADAQVTFQIDITAVVPFAVGNDVEQRGFSRTIFGNECYPLVVGDRKGYIFKKQIIAKRFGQIFYLHIVGHTNVIFYKDKDLG